jgi:hypothetical protein
MHEQGRSPVRGRARFGHAALMSLPKNMENKDGMDTLLDRTKHRRGRRREYTWSQSTWMAPPVTVRDITAAFRLALAGFAAQREVHEPSGLTN